jgi:hypothetical protein
MVVGYNVDDRLGAISSKCVFQVGTQFAVNLDRHTTEYIGLRLYLKRDGYSYYDTTQIQTIAVHQLTRAISLYNGFRYSTSTFEMDPTPLGKLSFYPRPHSKDSLEVILPDALGLQLMTMAQNHDIAMSANDQFIKFFKGLVLLADSTSSRGTLGFVWKPEMRLYYRDLSAPNTSPSAQIKHVTFGSGTNVRFNHYYADRSGTSLSALKKKNQSVSSYQTEHEAYVQAGSGLQIRIQMPYLRDFLFNDRNFAVSRAVLELRPLLTGTSQSAPPPVLSIYRVDGENRLLTAAPQGAPLIKDLELGQNTRYSADITAFVNFQIQSDVINSNALLLLLDNAQYSSSINRVYIGDQKNDYQLKLKLYYISLSNQ